MPSKHRTTGHALLVSLKATSSRKVSVIYPVRRQVHPLWSTRSFRTLDKYVDGMTLDGLTRDHLFTPKETTKARCVPATKFSRVQDEILYDYQGLLKTEQNGPPLADAWHVVKHDTNHCSCPSRLLDSDV